ncbi:MAG: hypothetical protein ACKV19_22250 [Verrucomicrobiales bacterium]
MTVFPGPLARAGRGSGRWPYGSGTYSLPTRVSQWRLFEPLGHEDRTGKVEDEDEDERPKDGWLKLTSHRVGGQDLFRMLRIVLVLVLVLVLEKSAPRPDSPRPWLLTPSIASHSPFHHAPTDSD